MPVLDDLDKILGYRFSDVELLKTALTHRSAGGDNNERLEFIGDAILSLIISIEIYQRFPDADEGKLSRIRASLVKGDTLAKIARELELGGRLRLGAGELKSGGFRRESILADSLEAVFGAIYLDGGMDACRAVVVALFDQRLRSLPSATSLKDPKTQLQEYLQSRKMALPAYQVLRVEGNPPTQVFFVECSLADLGQTTVGEGGSRRKAEQDAARKALGLLTNG